jgi:nitrous-oxide reductase
MRKRVRGFDGWIASATILAGLGLLLGCDSGSGAGSIASVGEAVAAAPSGQSVPELMKERGLSEADVVSALKTYVPPGKRDEYVLFASGGHSGQLLVIGVPSMRLLKVIGVFTPEPWQGFGFDDDTKAVLKAGSPAGETLSWADDHHPALSESKGDYDGKYIFVNDKANARIAVVNLEDFTTVQIVRSGLIQSDHGGTFVTPNSEYVIEGSQYPTPLGGGYAPIEDFQKSYRGALIYWKFDREKGRIDPARSWAIELPPYMQDLSDAGKLVSDGWSFTNSFDTEMSYGGISEGRPPLESGASQNDMDYMHVVNWKKAEELVAGGKAKTIAGMKVLPMDVAAAEGVLTLVPEPKSPHGVDVTPDGKEIVVSGKLDTHGTVYSFEKIKQAIDQKKFAGKDPFGIPILPFEQVMRGQVEIGLGPLHTQFDDKGFAYTSVFIESVVAKWSLKDLKVVQKIPCHYNIGHLVTAEGDTVSPKGKYLVAMDKWSIDRFQPVGPLLPQNFQLMDIGGESVQLLYDMPIGIGEPHYAQMIRADKLKPIPVYKPVGTNPVLGHKDPQAVDGGKERIERKSDGVHVYMTAVRCHFTPDTVRVKQGDTLHFHITNIEQTMDATHGFAVDAYNINLSLEPGKNNNVTFKADRPGVFPMYCTEFCSALHLEMAGYLLVEPTGEAKR